MTLRPGTRLARKFKLVRAAGFGGMAELWVAVNEATGAEVCVKVLVVAHAPQETARRFRREANAIARLYHRSVVRIFDLVELDEHGDVASSPDTAYALAIVMELLRGRTLADVLLERGALETDDALDVALPLCSALGHAHELGVVHRDVKPDNVFLAEEPDGHVIPKLLDFGVSKIVSPGAEPLTSGRVMLGTPSFMSPEQARREAASAQSDVFSLGIVLYVMLEGRHPFEATRFDEVVQAIVERAPPPLVRAPPALADVVMRALAKDPASRPPDGRALGAALREASGRAFGPDSRGYSIAPPTRGEPKKPLGGDSLLSVPPTYGGDSVRRGTDRPSAGAATRRSLRAVVLMLAGSLALAAIAVSRSPSRREMAATAPPAPSSIAPAAAGAEPAAAGAEPAAVGLAPAEPTTALDADAGAPPSRTSEGDGGARPARGSAR